MIYSALTKERAIRFRKNGWSYSEILEHVHVSQSTLTSWLAGVPLLPEQVDRLAMKRQRGNFRGARKRHNERLELCQRIKLNAAKEIVHLTTQDLRLIGTVLYWAEGSKESRDRPGSGIIFTNEDSRVVQIFLRFLREVCNVEERDIRFELYIHLDRKDQKRSILKYWSASTGFSAENFKIYYKRNTRSDDRQNPEKLYHGTLRVRVCSSSSLLRRIQGWFEEVSRQLAGSSNPVGQ